MTQVSKIAPLGRVLLCCSLCCRCLFVKSKSTMGQCLSQCVTRSPDELFWKAKFFLKSKLHLQWVWILYQAYICIQCAAAPPLHIHGEAMLQPLQLKFIFCRCTEVSHGRKPHFRLSQLATCPQSTYIHIFSQKCHNLGFSLQNIALMLTSHLLKS